MKKVLEEYKEVIIIGRFFLLLIAFITACVIFIPYSKSVIVTDTGHVLEKRYGLFGSSNYRIFEESKTVVIIENGEYTSYKYNDWYVFDCIQGKSLWQRWTEEGNEE